MRVSRFTFTATNIANSEVVLYTDPDGLQGNIYHFGGDIQFGPGLPSCLSNVFSFKDGMLYISQGEKSMTGSSTATNNAVTCALRINVDGSIPAGNNNGGKKPACWLWGLRNGDLFSPASHASLPLPLGHP